MFGKLLCLSGSASFHLSWLEIPAQIPNVQEPFGALWATTAPHNDYAFRQCLPCSCGGIHHLRVRLFWLWLRGRWHHVPHRYIILQDARHRTGLMDAGAILYIHSVSHLMASTSERNTALYQMLQSSPRIQSPVSTAFSAIKQFFSHRGVFPSTVFIIAILNMYMFTIRVQR